MNRRELILLMAGALTVVRPLRAQQKPMPVVGYLAFGTPDSAGPLVAALRQGLSEIGYFDGQNVAIEFRGAEGDYDRLPALAADLVAHKVDVIVATAQAALAAKNVTSTIPIVFAGLGGGDPVTDGLVASLARPGGNLTGFSSLAIELNPKRLELLSEMVPQTRVMGLLVNTINNPSAEHIIRVAQEAARSKRVQLQILKANSESEIDAAFATLVQLHAGAGVVVAALFFGSRLEQLVALASRYAVPAIYPSRTYVTSGGLISYGPTLAGTWRQAGVYAARILKGEKPADLPVQQPTTFELVVNLNTARALGLTVPPSILARADEVIE